MDPAVSQQQPLLSGATRRAHYATTSTTNPPPPPSPPPPPPPPPPPTESSKPSMMRITTPWLALAAASGACAAFNGVFAKLTTTDLTSSWASAISAGLGLASTNKAVEFVVRATFFSLNLAFNALMWALFTAALTRATSTTRVSIINTSSNFICTAFLGFVIFKESLPPLWWLGAAGLVVGNVIIGRREEEGEEGGGKAGEGDSEREREGYRDQEEEEHEEAVEEIEMSGDGVAGKEGVESEVAEEREARS